MCSPTRLSRFDRSYARLQLHPFLYASVLMQRPEAHVFPYLEEAEAFEGAVLLATTAEGSKDRRATFRRSIWRSGHKRSRRNCFK